MIPSDQFVRFYNEVFKFLDAQPGDALEAYYRVVSEQQEMHCLHLFKEQGLAGMKAYWDRIAVEENCDMSSALYPDRFELVMNRCPSLSKAMDNDAGAFPRYCDHCPGWVVPLIEKAGFRCEYDMIDRAVPQCRLTVYPAEPGRTSRVLVTAGSREPLPLACCRANQPSCAQHVNEAAGRANGRCAV
jgi:hypothetical protein